MMAIIKKSSNGANYYGKNIDKIFMAGRAPKRNIFIAN